MGTVWDLHSSMVIVSADDDGAEGRVAGRGEGGVSVALAL